MIDLGLSLSRLRDSNPRPTHYEMSGDVPQASTAVLICGIGADEVMIQTTVDFGAHCQSTSQLRLELRLAQG